MNGIQLTDINCIQPHRVIRPGGDKRGQTFASFSIFTSGIRRRRPARRLLLTLYRSHPVTWGFSPRLANANRQDINGIAPFRIVVKTHFRHVNHNAFTHGIRQNKLLRHHQRRTGLRQKDVHIGIRFEHIAQPLSVLRRKRFQRLSIIVRDGYRQRVTDQKTPFWR